MDIHNANSAKGALSKLSWSGDRYRENPFDTDLKTPPPVTLDTSMSEAYFSGKHLGVSGALILAAFISGKYFQDNGAMSILNVSKNFLGPEGAKALAPAM